MTKPDIEAVKARATEMVVSCQDAGAKWVMFTTEDLAALLAHCAETEAENERLERLVYVPGLLKCAKCGFTLIKSTLDASSGAVKADNTPDRCPNDGAPMWRVSERDAGNEVCDRLDAQVARAELAEQRLAAAVEALRQIDQQPTLIRTITDSVMRIDEHEVLSAYDVRKIARALLPPADGGEHG